MNTNLGKLDRIFRFVLAVWWIGPLAPQFGAEWATIVIAIIGWIALFEALLGYCWLHTVLKIDNKHQ